MIDRKTEEVRKGRYGSITGDRGGKRDKIGERMKLLIIGKGKEG